MNGVQVSGVDRPPAGDHVDEGLRGAGHYDRQELRLPARIGRLPVELGAQRGDPFCQFSCAELVQHRSNRLGQPAFATSQIIANQEQFGKARHLLLQEDPLNMRIPQSVERFELTFQHPPTLLPEGAAGDAAQEREESHQPTRSHAEFMDGIFGKPAATAPKLLPVTLPALLQRVGQPRPNGYRALRLGTASPTLLPALDASD